MFKFEAVGEFFEGAVVAFRLRPAKFFADLYEQGVEFIEKPGIGREIRLK
jgi:hypothetical protein